MDGREKNIVEILPEELHYIVVGYYSKFSLLQAHKRRALSDQQFTDGIPMRSLI